MDLYNFKFTVSFKVKLSNFVYKLSIHTMPIILDSIAELEITLNHQPLSDHFMN